MKSILYQHFEVIFEMSVLVVLFIVGAILLAKWPDNEELANWVTGGAIISIVARALGSRNGNGSKPEDKKEP